MTLREAYDGRKKELMDPKKGLRSLVTYGLIVVFLVAFVLLSNRFLWATVKVFGRSMDPTLKSGDVLIVSKTKTPKIGDIIVVHAYDDGAPYIKRVYGLAGDKVGVDNGKVYRKYLDENGVWQTQWDEWVTVYTPPFSEFTVGKNEIFFLGDNRAVSDDSRSIGCRKLSDVVGVVTKFSLKHKTFLTKLFG